MPNVKPILASLYLLSACSNDSMDPPANTTPDAAVVTPDAPPTPGTCGGTADRLVLSGPITVDSTSLGPMTVEGKVAGWMGAAGGGEVFAFSKRRVPLDGDWESVGVHDIGTEHVKFLQMPFQADCSTPAGMCDGFIALSGTVTVTAIAPRFLATFQLADLHARADSSNNLGAPIAGTITGCVNSRLDP